MTLMPAGCQLRSVIEHCTSGNVDILIYLNKTDIGEFISNKMIYLYKIKIRTIAKSLQSRFTSKDLTIGKPVILLTRGQHQVLMGATLQYCKSKVL